MDTGPATVDQRVVGAGAPWDISVFSGTIGHERSVTLSYHDTVHDRHILQEAAEAITDPIRLLR